MMRVEPKYKLIFTEADVVGGMSIEDLENKLSLFSPNCKLVRRNIGEGFELWVCLKDDT